MHDHRNGGPPGGLPDPFGTQYRAQKILLLELVVDPPPERDRLDDLIERLGLPLGSVAPAALALAAIGLVRGDGEVLRASPPAPYFEYLWPVLL